MIDPNKVPALHDYLTGLRSIDDAFKVYRRYVLPPDAGETQVIETRRAFFAAADWFYKRFLVIVDDEKDAMAFLSEIHAELEAHCKAVQEGRA